MKWLLALAFVCGWASSSSAQTTQPDPVAPLLRRFEQALGQSDRPALTSLFSPDVATSEVDLYLGSLLMPGAVKTTVRLRDRSPLEGAPPGDGYSLVVEFFIETTGRARILTASMDMRRPTGGDLVVLEVRRRGGSHVRRGTLQAADRQASAHRAQPGDHVRRSGASVVRRHRLPSGMR